LEKSAYQGNWGLNLLMAMITARNPWRMREGGGQRKRGLKRDRKSTERMQMGPPPKNGQNHPHGQLPRQLHLGKGREGIELSGGEKEGWGRRVREEGLSIVSKTQITPSFCKGKVKEKR